MKRRLVSTGIGCVLAGLLAVGLFGHFGSTSGAPAAKLPASLASIDGGKRVALPVLGRPQPEPTVITFFASWCAPCEGEMPVFSRFANSEIAKGARIAFIGVDESDQSGGKAFVHKLGLDFPVGVDPYGQVLEDLDANGFLPQTFFIDSAGRIAYHHYGSITAGGLLETWTKKVTTSASKP